MVINLSEDVDWCEYVEVVAYGKNIGNINLVELSFSREALMGFAKNLIWTYEDIGIDDKFYICTDPLGGVPSGNQAVGFYLTADSPTLIFSINAIDHFNRKKYHKLVDMQQSVRMEKAIEIVSPSDGVLLEEYELGFRNIVKIALYDKDNNDITSNFHEVHFKINYEGLKNLAILLLKLFDNYKEGMDCFIGCDNNLEVILTDDSLPIKLKCRDLGNAYDYEVTFGMI